MVSETDPRRRRLLVAVGAGLVSTAGCLGSDDAEEEDGTEDGTEGGDAGGDGDGTDTDGGEATNETEDDANESDESAPETEESGRQYDGDYEVGEHDDIEVPLIPIDDAYEWYENDEAHFVDARSELQYQRTHIAGAVLSPADGEDREDDPVSEVATDERIVTYCGCPHHLSVMRGAELIDEGYEEVYALDEGLGEWKDRDYPLEGTNTDDDPELRVVRGTASPASAGEMVLAEDEATGQLEAAPIDDDGTYELHLRFADLTPTSTIRVETPDYRTRASIDELTSGRIGDDGTVRR